MQTSESIFSSEEKKRKKNRAIALFLLLAVLAGAAAAFFGIRSLFNGKTFTLFYETEGNYSYGGFLLERADGEGALYYRPLERGFEAFAPQTLSLEKWGLGEGEYRYYAVDTIAAACNTPEAEGLWTVSKPDRIVLSVNGKKWCVEEEKGLCYPIFADSAEGVSEGAEEVLAFSKNGYFALALDGTEAVVYRKDNEKDSTRIARVDRVDLSAFGENIRFGAFTDDRDAYFISEKDGEIRLFALDCNTLTLCAGKLDENYRYGALVSRVYLERLPTEKEEKDKKNLHLHWTNALLGTQYGTALPRATYQSAALLSISPDGKTALISAKTVTGEEKLLVAEKSGFAEVADAAPELSLESAYLVYENILFVNYRDGEGKALARAYRTTL